MTTSLDKKTSAILSYAFGWLTGTVFLFIGKHDPDVKFHAAQSIIFFGAVTVANIALSIAAAVLGPLAFIASLASLALGVFALVIWVLAMVHANSNGGVRAALPVVGKFTVPYADQLANAVK
ncbi:DUF4870 domain-containing protein [Nocardia camponoti]|uniref:DUF4870 domain-containing protein n=1 Tax=Nocardia camponoti TaxID=1616106 RepID=A0A917V4F5_9NOCA|nr:hypothetical protein [Nocardia camponoti]GGK38333.1 hypothetical protein GCM10011591_07510 [Nocardia camponoti]